MPFAGLVSESGNLRQAVIAYWLNNDSVFGSAGTQEAVATSETTMLSRISVSNTKGRARKPKNQMRMYSPFGNIILFGSKAR